MKKYLFIPTRFEYLLFFYLFIAYAFFFNEIPGWNVKSRMNLVYAIVEQGRFQIDSYWDKAGFETMDVAYYAGHYYSDKSPILSFMGVPIYWLWKNLWDLTGFYVSPLLGRYPVVLFTVSLFSALLAIIIYRSLGIIRDNPIEQYWLTIFYALGTLALPYSILFISHQAGAFFLYSGFFMLFILFHGGMNISSLGLWKYLIFAGLMAGFAVAIEPPNGLAIIIISGYLYYRLKNKRMLFWFLTGLFLPQLLVFYYNYISFGHPFSIGYEHLIWEPFRIGMAQGLMGITYPKWEAIWGITLSPFRGLFFQSPILLFAIPGLYYFYRNKKYFSEWILFLLIILGFFYINFSYYAWTGGWAPGPRHLTPMLPFLLIPIYQIFPKIKKWIYLTGFYSVFYMILVSISEPQVPEQYQIPIFEFHLNRILNNILTQNILSLFGISRAAAVIIWLFYLLMGMIILAYLSQKIQKNKST